MSVIINPGSGGSSGTLTVGVTPISGGTAGYALIDNAGTLEEAPIRTLLTADATYYVNSATGSDSNPGTALLPWQTLQHTYDVISGTLDGGGIYNVTCNLAGAGPYTLDIESGCVGISQLNILGAGSGTTTINDLVTGWFNTTNLGVVVNVDSVALSDTGLFEGFMSHYALGVMTFGFVNGDMIVNPGGATRLGFSTSGVGSQLQLYGNITIAGGSCHSFITVSEAGFVFLGAPVVTLTGTPAFNRGFMAAFLQGQIDGQGDTYSGAATGPRFIAATLGVLSCFAPSPTFYPGSTEGILITDAIFCERHIISSPTTGGTVNMSFLQPTQILTPAGTLATLTINLPPIPDGGVIYGLAQYAFSEYIAICSTTETLTALTVAATDGSTIVGAPTTLAANSSFSMIWDEANNAWYPWIDGGGGGGGGGLTINSTTISGGTTDALLYGDGTKLQNTTDITYGGSGTLTTTADVLTLNAPAVGDVVLALNATSGLAGLSLVQAGALQWELIANSSTGIGFYNNNVGFVANNKQLAFFIGEGDNQFSVNGYGAYFQPTDLFILNNYAGGTYSVAGFGSSFLYQFVDGGSTIRAGIRLTGTEVDATSGAISTTWNVQTALGGTLKTGLTVDQYQGVQIGNAALATNATQGFLYIPTCAGTPTGTPTSFTGLVPMVYDTTNHQFWFYDGGWKQPKTPAGAAIITWQ